MAELIPIEEHELLVFWVQLFVILVFARSLGWMMRKIRLARCYRRTRRWFASWPIGVWHGLA